MPDPTVLVSRPMRLLRSHPATIWRSAHYFSLAAGLVCLLLLSRGQWFYFDEWDIIWSPEGMRRLVEGHNGHWSLVPILLWTVLQRTFGLGSYLPFVLCDVVAHLVVAHLLWRVMLRLRIDPWLATASVGVFVFFGAAWENLTWAFQMGFVGAIAFSLGAVLVASRRTMGWGAVSATVILLLLGVATAGTALPFLPVVFVATWRRHGLRKAAVTVGAPIAVYLGWYLLLAGPNPTAVFRATGVAASLAGIPQFAATMLTGSWNASTPVPDLGLAVMVALATGGLLLLRRRPVTPRTITLLGLCAAGVLFSLLTAYSRLGLGVGAAVESRYVYVVVLTTLPSLCALLTALARGLPARIAVLALIGVVGVYNVGVLGGAASTSSAREVSTHALLSAALRLATEHPGEVDLDAQPDPVYVPRSLAQIQELVRDDGLTEISFDETTRLSALANVGTTISPASPGVACPSQVALGDDVQVGADGVVIVSPDGGPVTFVLVSGDATGAPRTITLDPGPSRLDLAEVAAVRITDAAADVQLCTG